MNRFIVAFTAVALASAVAPRAADPPDPFAPYLDGKAPEILRDVPSTNAPPENITVRRVVFRSRDDSEIFAVIATPKTPGRHPGMLVLHGGGGRAEVDKAMAWAQRGYVAVAPDLPGIAEPKKLTETKGKWSSLKYGEGRWVATPDAGASVIFDAVLSAMKSLYLLRAQPDVDPARIGVVGISWGGYMATMVCGLAGDQVRAGFAVFGCGFYDLTAQFNGPNSTLGKLSAEERERWLLHLDAGRRAPGMKAAFFIAGAANDFFYWPRAVQATLDAVPGGKNHLFAPNANHKVPLPGGTVFPNAPAAPFKPTPFQPFPTPGGSKANWLAMEVQFFDYFLKDIGPPLPKVSVRQSDDPLLARFSITAPCPLTKVEVYWAKANPDVMKREWLALAATKNGDSSYEVRLPAEAADWFAVASDDRPVTVSGDLIGIGKQAARTGMTPAEALAWALPGARSIVEERHRIEPDDAARLTAEAEVRIAAGEIVFHRGDDGTNVTGYALMVNEKGRDDPIMFVVALSPGGAIRDLEVAAYRAHYGGGIRDRSFLDQFRGRGDTMQLDVGAAIDAVSGATISSRSAARAARRALALFRHTHPLPVP